ncbi:serine hydrolase [Candidatus Poribacteria bacterium]|nr:serine hydrolase [Candidatus Poribacteria bacterium]
MTVFTKGRILFTFVSLIVSAFACAAVTKVSEVENTVYENPEAGVFMTRWLLLGPIPVPHDETSEKEKTYFEKDLMEEYNGEAEIKPESGTEVKIDGETYTWKYYISRPDITNSNEFGVVNLNKALGYTEYAVAYAYAEVVLEEDKQVFLGIGSDDAVKVWINGEMLHEHWVARALVKDHDIVKADLKKGSNHILLKIQNGIMDWAFSCRIVKPEIVADKMIIAAYTGDEDRLETFLSQGADVDLKDKSGLTPYNAAQIFGRQDMMQFLLEKGADPNIPVPPAETMLENELKEATEGKTPAVAILIAQDGGLIYKKAFGYANMEEKITADTDTIFRIGSITKQFVAAAILKMQEEGKSSVEDKLSKFIPDFPRGDEVTIYHLLTHTSGIHSFTSNPEFFKNMDKKITPEEMVNAIKSYSYDFDPGEKWLYNNSGYFILGYIVEKISGKTLGEYLDEKFFKPLDMERTGIHSWDLDLENEARGYSNKEGKLQPADKWDMSQAGGAGAMYSTIDDMYRWNEAIFNGEILSEESLNAAFTPARLKDDSEANAMGAKYGYGWMISDARGLKNIHHGGGFDGFNAYIKRIPEHNFTVVVLTNALPPPTPKEGSPGIIASAISQLAVNLYLWEHMEQMEIHTEDDSINTGLYDDYVGNYDYGNGGIMKITKEDGKLMAQLIGQPKSQIFPEAKDKFFWKVVDAQIEFIRDESGNVTHAMHYQSNLEIKAEKMSDEGRKEVDIDPEILDDYVGEYDFGRAVLTITKEDDKLMSQMSGQPKVQIFPGSKDEFFWKVVNAQVKFIRDENGKVIKAAFQQGPVKIEVKKIK